MKPRYTRSELGRVDGRGQEESISRKRRRRGKRQGRCKRDPIHSGGESSQAAEEEERTSRTDLEIPGFYYDPEKKKYFKIQPNQFSSLGHTVTKQNIEKKTKETARIQKLNKQTDKVHAHHFLDLVSRQAMGDLSNLQFQRYFIHKRISCIDNYPSQTLNATSSYGTLEHPKVMGLNSNRDKLISMWSLASSLAKCINFVDINSDSTGDTVIDFNKPCLNLCICASSMFWTETKNSLPLHLLYTTEPYFGNENCTAHICQVSNQGLCGTTNSYSLGQQYVWCCALDSDYRSFCIGCQKGALLIEVETRRLWEIGAHKSNVSSTVFTNKSPSILYCGNTKGLIFSHDTRSHANQTPSQLKMKGIVTSLQLTGDDIHLLASDTLGNAYLWDLRMKKVLVEYKGMKNESTRIPLHLDDGEKLVYGCDLEGYTRLWCKTSGKLLRTIPSPVPCSSTSVPAVLYCENLGNRPGNSAVILGAGNKLYVYKV